jgi:hypothetical protein
MNTLFLKTITIASLLLVGSILSVNKSIAAEKLYSYFCEANIIFSYNDGTEGTKSVTYPFDEEAPNATTAKKIATYDAMVFIRGMEDAHQGKIKGRILAITCHKSGLDE